MLRRYIAIILFLPLMTGIKSAFLHHMTKILLLISCIIFALPAYSQKHTATSQVQKTGELDSLKKSLSLSTDSLEVAQLCYEIYRHLVYDLLMQSPDEGAYLMRALRNFKSLEKWSEVGDVYRFIGGEYFNRKQFSTAKKYWDFAQESYSKAGNLEHKVFMYSNMSELYMYDTAKSSQDLVKVYLDSANDLGVQLQDSLLLIHPFMNLGEWYSKRNEMSRAEKYVSLSISLAKRQQNARSIQMGIFQLGLINKKKGNVYKTIDLMEKSLSLKALRESGPITMDAYFELSNLHYALGNYKKAYDYLHIYKTHEDTLFRDEEARALLKIETSHETEKRDLKIKKQESDIALLAARNNIKNQWILFGTIGLIALFGFVLLVRSRSTLKNQKKLQEKFSQDLIAAQEEERTRIAKELHDSVGQQLTLIKKKAQNERQNEYTSLTNTALEEVRSISRALYPASLKQLGLSESIEQLLYDLDEEVDMFFSVDIEDINNTLDENKTLNFYRFIQESVNNVIKHAKAKTLKVGVTKNQGTIEVSIEDNGCGFKNTDTLQSESLGLKTMAERIRILKGTLSIYSKIGQGTTVTAKIPVSV